MLKFQTTPAHLKTNIRPNSFRIQFGSQSKQHTFPTNIRAKLFPKNSHFPELELFKRQLLGVGKVATDQTYAIHWNKVLYYRTIFFALGALFIGISAFTFFQNLIFFTLLLGNLSFFAKGALSGTSLLLALLAIFFGFSLCIAREASHQIAIKAKRKLLQHYARKKIEKGIQGLYILGEQYRIHSVLKQRYKETLEQIKDQKEETIHLLQEIHRSTTLSPSHRELLFNQALAEMQERLYGILHVFKTDDT